MRDSDRIDIALIFDGGSLNNPGRGYGSYRLTTNGVDQPIRELDFGDGVTSNQAEYRTLIEGLHDAIRILRKYRYDPRQASVSVMTDSRLVVEQTRGRWKVKNEGLKPLNLEARRLLNEFGQASIAWHSRSESVRVLGH